MRKRSVLRTSALFTAAALIAAQPLGLNLGGHGGPLKSASALAKNGGGGHGGSGGGGSSGGSGSSGGGGHGGSGSSGSSGGGNSSSGGGSSHGGGSSGGKSSSSGGGSSSGNGSARGGDDHGGRGDAGSNGRASDDNGDDRRVGERRQADDGRRGLEHVSARTGAKVEVNGRNIEVTTADGFKEEIENGRYELKDRRGRTIVERTATAADRARLFDQAR